MENPSDLVFDTKLPVIPQYEHIFGDEENAARLPKEVRDSSMKMQLFDGALKQTKECLRQITERQFHSIIITQSNCCSQSVSAIRENLTLHWRV